MLIGLIVLFGVGAITAALAGIGWAVTGKRWSAALIGSLGLVALVLVGPVVGFWTDLLWFRSIGFESVYWVRFSAPLKAFGLAALGAFVFLLLNLLPALRIALPAPSAPVSATQRRARDDWAEGYATTFDSAVARHRGAIIAIVSTLVPLGCALLVGWSASNAWETFLAAGSRTDFGATDPVFGQDVGFYVFSLPALHTVGGIALVTVGTAALAVGLAYLLGWYLAPDHEASDVIRSAALRHAALIGALALAALAFTAYLGRFDTLFSDEKLLTGANYVTANVRLGFYDLGWKLLTLLALLTVSAAFSLRMRFVAGGAASLWLAFLLVQGAWPALVQKIEVDPSQLQKETPYLARHITATRTAFGLDRIEGSTFAVASAPTPGEVAAEATTIGNIRVQDWRALQKTLTQIQTVRQFYSFPDVDISRLVLDGKTVQVMLAARELDPSRAPDSWVARHLVYTHGYGAVVVPVNAATAEGLPTFALKDLPPRGEIAVTSPQIYFGSRGEGYVVVGTDQNEYDYPTEAGDQYTHFASTSGLALEGIDRLLFAIRFTDDNLLLAGQITPSSRLLMHRAVTERARMLMPGLEYDPDPYLAIADGKLFWIQDAYTHTSRYPYAREIGGDRYIRNAVKVVTDAYDGAVTFYAVDAAEPITATYAKIYPGLFRPLAEMPTALRAQLRYPEGLFKIQATAYGRYHVTDPGVFYANAQAWDQAREVLDQGSAARTMDAYYVLAQLPGETQPEFILMVPFTPSGKTNMSGWLAGRVDGTHFNTLRALRFPGDRNILGPEQFEAKIEQEPSIKKDFALLHATGSTLFRGNTLVLPLGSSLLYVEPVYIQANATSIPELRRVIVATQERTVMAETLAGALSVALGPELVLPATPGGSGGAVTTLTPEVRSLIKSVSDHYAASQEAMARSDFARFGTELAAMQSALERLRALAGVR